MTSHPTVGVAPTMLRTGYEPDPSPDQTVVLSRRVLIAEDDRTVAVDVADLLTSAGFDVVGVAQDGPLAVEMVARLRPDVVLIMDITTPGSSGFHAAGLISDRGICPVIMMSAATGPDLVGQAVSAGAMAYLVKPVYAASLLATIEIAIARYAEQHQLREQLATMKQHLEEVKLVDRAKGLLMARHRLTEVEAARWLQQTADHHSRPVHSIAREFIADPTGRRLAYRR